MVWKEAFAPAAPPPLRGRRLGVSPPGPPVHPAAPAATRSARRRRYGRWARPSRRGARPTGPPAGADLPWRRTRDPWAVLVSETLAQQTQLARVVPAYHRFLAAFPTPAACAAAPLGDVLRAWEGMGYNRRAKNLHRAARVMVADHGGSVPDDLDALLALPGVGPYTARAVLAFAFERDVGVVDTNAGRVIARAVAGRPVRPGRGPAAGRRHGPARSGLVVRPGPARPGGDGLHRPGARLRRLPAPPAVPVGRGRPAGPGPGPGFGRGVGGPGPFAGSDRQGRGRLVARRCAPDRWRADGLAPAAGWPDDPAGPTGWRDGLVAEGLAVRDRTARCACPDRSAARRAGVGRGARRWHGRGGRYGRGGRPAGRRPGRRTGSDPGERHATEAAGGRRPPAARSPWRRCWPGAASSTSSPTTTRPTVPGNPTAIGAPASVPESVLTIPTPAVAGHAGQVRPGPGAHLRQPVGLPRAGAGARAPTAGRVTSTWSAPYLVHPRARPAGVGGDAPRGRPPGRVGGRSRPWPARPPPSRCSTTTWAGSPTRRSPTTTSRSRRPTMRSWTTGGWPWPWTTSTP